jgi:hypothetical protein
MNEDFDQYRNQDQEENDTPGQRRMPRRRTGMPGQGMDAEPPERGFYGRGYGYGESPYTSSRPSFRERTGTGESPYTNYGPRTTRRPGYGESPYTSQPPGDYSERYSSGESPYTDYGPHYASRRDMERSMRRNMEYDQNQGYEPMSYTYMEFWMVPGPETGRGPRDYRRSDERIVEDIVERLMLHGYIDAGDITIAVANGEVTLSGNVRSRREKRMAEDVVDSVTGVQDVHNELKVKPERQTSSDIGSNQA